MKVYTTGSEGNLVEMTTAIKADPSGYYALHFNSSKLMENYRSDYQLKIALNVLTDLYKQEEGGVFLCRDADIFVIYKGEDRALLEKGVFQLRYLFVDDPLAYDGNGDENPDFCRVYDLAFQWHEFHDVARRKFGKIAKGEEDVPSTQQAGNRGYGTANTLKPINLSALVMMETDLRRADLSLAFRRQPVCVVMKDGTIKPVFDEIYIHLPHLRKIVGVDFDFTSNRGLFKYLTQMLDGHVLGVLGSRAGVYLRTPVSINLNLETILSEGFIEFDKEVKSVIKASIILEIQVADVFADINAYVAARNLAHNLGYRVCIDGLSRLSVTQIGRESMGFDFAKMHWNADMKAELSGSISQPLRDAIARFGAHRMILCRCDSKHAIDYGQALGVTLFQGRYTDKIVDPTSRIVN